MIKHHFKIFLRNLARRDAVTYINIIGLSVGLACSILILLWIKNELSYDTFHSNFKDIYRIQLTTFREGVPNDSDPITMVPIGPALNENFPEIKSFVRLRQFSELTLQQEDKHYSEDNFLAADSSFFDVFSFNLIEGDPKTALSEPYSIVLSESIAKKIFANESALGKSLLINGADHFIVSGVVENPPQNSHIKFNGLISINTMWKDNPCTKWDCNYSFYTYLLLNPGSNPIALEAKFPDFLWEPLNKKNAQAGWKVVAGLMPLGDVHFKSTSNYEMESPGNTGMIFLFSAIALFILVIACINFINLTTAQASKKGKEIGIKKVAGATRNQLAAQLIGEVFIQTSIALIIAVVIAELTLPAFNNLLHMNLDVEYQSSGFIMAATLLLVVITLGSGAYPALYLTKFHPAEILKGKVALGAYNSGLRNTLVVIQFTISIALIAGTFIIYNQLHFLTNHDLGFDKENIITIPMNNDEARDQWEQLKLEMNRLPEVVSVGASTFVPGGGSTSNGYLPEGFDSPIMLKVLDIDEDYLRTMGVELVSGRNFSKEFATDKSAFIINEQLAKQLDWDDPVGKTINRNRTKHPIIGVVRDFNFSSLHHQMEPIIISQNPWEGIQSYGYLSVRIQSGNISQSIQKLEEIWKNQVTSLPFEFSFLEDRINNLYLTEKRLGETFIYFSSLAILISCMGLFGLVLFLVDQKTKEIGIRKTLGGSVADILLLLSKDLTKWILFALILAVPLTWFAMDRWLMNFAYATEIRWWIFALAGLLTILISWITVSWHTIKAALKNPVEALRYE